MSYTVKNRISDLKQEIQKFQTSNPFANYNFLNALEKTDCLNESSGWKAQYLLGKNESLFPFMKKIIVRVNLFLIMHGQMLTTDMGCHTIQK